LFLKQLQKLSDLVVSSHDGGREDKGGKEHSIEDGGSGSGYSSWKPEEKPRFSNEGLEERVGVYSDDQNENSMMRSEKSEDKGHQVLRMDDNDHAEMPLASLEKWYNSVDPNGILDQSCSSSQWLDFWTWKVNNTLCSMYDVCFLREGTKIGSYLAGSCAANWWKLNIPALKNVE